MRCFLRFFTLSQSTSTKMNLLHTAIRKQMTWREKMKNNNQCEFVTQSIQFVFFTDFCLFVCLSSIRRYSVTIFAVNQNAPINKNSKSSNPRNLKQHTFAKSISFCCFCFLSAREIGRFIILMCRYLREQDSQQDFHSSRRIYLFIFCFRIYFFTSIAFALKLSAPIMIRQIFESSSMIFFAMSIDQKKWYIRFETKLEKNEEIVLRACLKSRLKVYFISESSYEN